LNWTMNSARICMAIANCLGNALLILSVTISADSRFASLNVQKKTGGHIVTSDITSGFSGKLEHIYVFCILYSGCLNKVKSKQQVTVSSTE
jgi:hypothetical protein